MTKAKTRGFVGVFAALLAACLAFAVAPAAARADSALELTNAPEGADGIQLLADDDIEMIQVSGTFHYYYATQVVDLVNQQRAANGVPALTMDEDLTEAAMLRAAELAVFFSHTRPDGSSCFTVSPKASGENIAAGSLTPDGTMDQWMNSTGHRENILRSSFSSIGVGCFSLGDVTYWVQLFGTGAGEGSVDPVVATGCATLYFDTAYVPVDRVGFNLNEAQVNPQPLAAGETYTLWLCIPNAGWDAVFCTFDGDGLTWESSDPSVATVSSTGVVTGVSSGRATISATTWGGRTWSKTFEVSGGAVVPPVDDPVTPPQLSEPEDVPGYVEGENVVMWRLYNPNTGEHFYTSTQSERADLVAAGWKDEGAGWLAPIDGTPVYRLYNSVIPGGDHHYTRDKAEYDMLVSVGWTGEGIGWYSEDESGAPIYRQYNPNATNGTHNYTADASERDMLVSVGWVDEGIGWYGCR
ncbi:CAP domain-containing protein [Olsenella sp. An293]|uniref:CAP domain-containing protein n=1 Tax=Olsenella sp. An293 TaxID=1965626 RepID=UPI000B3722B3|nr:CAP domain-containing protein [Olsenella sp. An293]OUO31944.1 hypothetical protein B5F85_08850 [Olsenella sp. An293]